MVRKSQKIPTGDRKDRLALAGEADVTGLVRRVQEEAQEVVGLTDAEVDEMDKEIWSTIRVARRYTNQVLKDAIHGTSRITGGIDSHAKMKIGQDLLVSAMLHPKIRKSLLRAMHENPIAGAKLMVAMMPKDINVEVTQQQGVILVPMRMDNVDEWEKKAIEGITGEVIDVQGEEPRVQCRSDAAAGGDPGAHADG